MAVELGFQVWAGEILLGGKTGFGELCIMGRPAVSLRSSQGGRLGGKASRVCSRQPPEKCPMLPRGGIK